AGAGDVREDAAGEAAEEGARDDRDLRGAAAEASEDGVGQVDEEVARAGGEQHPGEHEEAQDDLGHDLGRDAHHAFGAEDVRLDHAIEVVGNAHQDAGHAVGEQRIGAEHDDDDQERQAAAAPGQLQHHQQDDDAHRHVVPARLHDVPGPGGEDHADAERDRRGHQVVDGDLLLPRIRRQRDEGGGREHADEDPVVLAFQQPLAAQGNAGDVGEPHAQPGQGQDDKEDALPGEERTEPGDFGRRKDLFRVDLPVSRTGLRVGHDPSAP